MVHEKSDEGVQVDGLYMLTCFSEITEADLIFHVLDFLVCGVVAHGSHQVWELLERNSPVQFSGFSCVLILTSNHGVVEEVFHVLESLPVSATFN